MRSTTRLVNPPKKKGPASMAEWQKLLHAVIDRTQRLGIPNEALRAAFAQVRSEQVLRRMGILSQVDIDREFPLTK